MSTDNCDCTDTIPLPQPNSGDSAYVYIGYAEDNTGTNFSTTPSSSTTHISIITTTSPQTNNAALHSGNWTKFHGDDGASSSSKAKILYNDHSSSTTSNGTYTTVKNFTLPAGTLSNDGDVLRIRGIVSHTLQVFLIGTSPAVTFKIYDTTQVSTIYSPILSTLNANGVAISTGYTYLVFDIELSRISNTSASAVTETKESKANTYQVSENRSFYDPTLNSSVDFDNQDTEIDMEIRSDGGGDITAEALIVEYINNP